MKKTILIFLLSALAIVSYSQQPSYYRLGEETFGGVDIYGLMQDQDENIWIATDQGLYRYDGYSYSTIDISASRAKSLFSLRTNSLGNIFCSNLKGQIFEVVNDSLHLYYEIPKNARSSTLYFEFDDLDQIIISSRAIYLLNKDKKLTTLIGGQYAKEIQKNIAGQIRMLDEKNQCFQYWHGNALHPAEASALNQLYESTPGYQPYSNHNIVRNSRCVYESLIDLNSPKMVWKTEAGKWEKIIFKEAESAEENLRYYMLKDKSIWISGNTFGGIAVYNTQGDKIYNNRVFQDFIISDIIDAADGSVWLGTLGEGILIIPNKSFVNYSIASKKTETFRDIEVIDNQLYALTRSDILRLENNQLVRTNLLKNVKALNLHALPDVGLTLLNSEPINLKTGQITNLRTSKRYSQFNTKTKLSKYRYAFGSAAGLYITDFSDLSKFPIRDDGIEKDQSKPLLHLPIGRTWSVAYDSVFDKLWVETTSGVSYFDDSLNEKACLLHGKRFSASALVEVNGQLWAGTKTGIHIFKKGVHVKSITTKNGLSSNDIGLLQRHQSSIFIANSLGLQKLNLADSSIQTLNPSDGLYSTRIQKLAFMDDAVYVKYANALQKINFDAVSAPSKLDFGITSLIVNNKPFWSSSSAAQDIELNHNENQIKLIFKAKGYNHRGNVTYRYRLKGVNDNWQTSDYRKNSVEYNTLRPGNYTFEVQAIRENQVESAIQTLSFSISPPWWRTWWFYIGITVLIGGLIYLYIRRLFIRQRLEMQLQNEVGSSKLTAIKSQMNPHFIFNSLNSIQDLVLSQEQDKAYSYIGKFAKLVRQVLHYSDKEFIDIDEEVVMLQVYLELEELRFKKDFTYSISAENLQDVQIPPMLIQPFAENAIKHGLLHKKGAKSLDISFSLKNETVTCLVEDNGIGREKSSEIKARQNRKHQSFSVQGTKDRFDLLKKQYGGALGVVFDDLKDAEKTPTGTRVVLTIPCKRKY